MTTFHINLIADRVPDYRRRRAFYCRMCLYLLVCGAVAIVVVNRGAKAVFNRLDRRSETRNILRLCALEYPGVTDLAAALERERVTLDNRVRQIRNLTGILTARRPVSPIVFGLARHLPPHIRVLRLEWQSAHPCMELDLACDDPDAAGDISATDMIAAWKQDAALMDWIEDIRPATMQRQSLGEHQGVIFRFLVDIPGPQGGG